MRVVIGKEHLSLHNKLIKELNISSRNFNKNAYSNIEKIDDILINQDISVEKKKSILVKKLHSSIIRTFSINRDKIDKSSLDLLKKRLHIIRKIIDKLKSINYYLETTFLGDLRLSKTKFSYRVSKFKQKDISSGELEAMEYTAYKLIGQAVALDKRLLKEYAKKEFKVLVKEKIELRDIDSILRKESALLEHLEAKLPPPNVVSKILLRPLIFTHWVSRVMALLSYFEHNYAEERKIFSELKQNKSIKKKINKKITNLIEESAKLLKIMEQKSRSIKTLKIDGKYKKELHNFTTTINL